METTINIAVMLLTIGINAWISMKIRFAKSEALLVKEIQNKLLRAVIWIAFMGVFISFVGFIMSPTPVTRFEIFILVIDVGLLLMILGLRLFLNQKIIQLELARMINQQGDALLVLGKSTLSLARNTLERNDHPTMP